MAPFQAMEIAPHVLDPVVGMVLSPWARIFAFVWGALWGSFGNVVIYRVPQGMSVIKPRSRCGSCGTPVSALDNIPILSYLLLRGRCRHCGEPFAVRYLVVEVIAGVLSFALFLQLAQVPLITGSNDVITPLLSWLLWFWFALSLVVITFIDLDAWIIPNMVVLPMAGMGLLVAWVRPEILGVPGLEATIAAVTGYGLFWSIRLLYLKTRGIEGLGLGDAKLLLMVGAFQGLPGLVWCIGAGAVQGLLISVPMMLFGKRVANTELHDVHGDDPELGDPEPEGLGKQSVPFGPFLALAAMEYVLLRPHLDALFEALVTP